MCRNADVALDIIKHGSEPVKIGSNLYEQKEEGYMYPSSFCYERTAKRLKPGVR
jgi:hypothetical protein